MKPGVVTQDLETSAMDSSMKSPDVNSDDLTIQCPSHTTEAALIRKVDSRVVPILMILYLMAFLDRSNIGNALTLGLPEDLKLKGNEPNVAITIFFVPYAVLAIPANLLMRRLKPHVWIPALVFLFGFITIMQGLVQSYSGLLATRLFLGIAETGMFPGCFYLMSMWYKRQEAQVRFTLFFNSVSVAAAFGGLLAGAIAKMDGIRGYSGWRWIFILEGILTCIVSVVGYFLVSDFPEDVQWLKEDEKRFLRERLRMEQGDPDLKKRLNSKDFMLFLKDFKHYVVGLMYIFAVTPAYGFVYFVPTILKSYGYGRVSTQLHTVPPAAVSFFTALLMAWASDRVQHRFSFVILSLCFSIAGGCVLLQVHHNLHLEYAALFFSAIGNGAVLPMIICWYTMNLRGHLERSIGTGWMIGFGNIGAIVAAFTFVASDAPFYHKGYSLLLGCYCLAALCAVAYVLTVWNTNRREKVASMCVGTGQDEPAEKEDLGKGLLFM